jgi:hypothetical protein
MPCLEKDGIRFQIPWDIEKWEIPAEGFDLDKAVEIA